MRMGKIYKLTKLILFILMGVAILVFNKQIMNNDGAIINGLVGSIIAIYGLEGLILPIATKKIKQEKVEMWYQYLTCHHNDFLFRRTSI